MIKLLIFDLDGTLVDSLMDLTNALNYAISPFAESHGLVPIEPLKTRELVGEGITKLIERMLGSEREAIKKIVTDRFMQYYSLHLTEYTRPYVGTQDALEKLSHIHKAVVSNKREALSKKILGDLGLMRYFDLVFGSDSTHKKKPSPEPLIKVINSLKCRHDETVMVGDSMFDIMAGRAAGVRTIAVSYGYRDRADLLSADFIIDDIEELPLLIEGMN